MKAFSFHPDAQSELEQAIEFYDEKRPGLGLELSDEVFASIRRILQNPNAWSKVSANTRRCLIHRFPYGIVYQALADEIFVIAVMHLSRRPNYFQDRIG